MKLDSRMSTVQPIANVGDISVARVADVRCPAGLSGIQLSGFSLLDSEGKAEPGQIVIERDKLHLLIAVLQAEYDRS